MNKRINILLLPLLLAVVSLGCHRQDVLKLVISVPDMHNEVCANRVVTSFIVNGHPMEGIQNVEIDVPGRQVTVTYDSRRIAIKNLVYAITKAGFDANGEPANEEARRNLPPECQPE